MKLGLLINASTAARRNGFVAALKTTPTTRTGCAQRNSSSMDGMKGFLMNENVKSNMMKRKGEAMTGGKQKAQQESKNKEQPEPVAAAKMEKDSPPKEKVDEVPKQEKIKKAPEKDPESGSFKSPWDKKE